MAASTLRPLAAVWACTLMWGFSSILVKTVDSDPLVASFYRLWFGVAFLWTYTLLRPGPRPTFDLPWLRLCFLGGALFGVHQIFFFGALMATRVANVTIVAALQPALVAMIAAPMFGERIPLRALPYLALAFAGVVVVILSSHGLPGVEPYGDLLAIANLLSFTAYFLASKRIRNHLDSIHYVTGMTTAAALVLSAAVLMSGRAPTPPSPIDAATLLAIAIVPGSIGHSLMNWAHPHLPAFTISSVILAVPVVASLGAAFFLGEQITAPQLSGGALTLAGVAVILRIMEPPSPVPPHDAATLPQPGRP